MPETKLQKTVGRVYTEYKERQERHRKRRTRRGSGFYFVPCVQIIPLNSVLTGWGPYRRRQHCGAPALPYSVPSLKKMCFGTVTACTNIYILGHARWTYAK